MKGAIDMAEMTGNRMALSGGTAQKNQMQNQKRFGEMGRVVAGVPSGAGLTCREMVEEVAAIFHLEGMDIPEDEQAELLHHLESGTLGDYVSQILSEGGRWNGGL